MASNPFKEINPTTGKVWRLTQLFEALEAERGENALMRSQLTKLLKDKEETEQKLLTNEQIINDIKLRWSIHKEESSALVNDVKNFGAITRQVIDPSLVKFASWCDNNSKVFNRA